MILTIILLGVFAVICNVFMDEIQFHWNRLFSRIFPSGSRSERWFNPSISWKNKYSTNSNLINLILSTLLVFITDFWHCLKFICITCAAVAILLALIPEATFWDYVIGVVLIHFGWGFVYETTTGIIGAISDINKK